MLFFFKNNFTIPFNIALKTKFSVDGIVNQNNTQDIARKAIVLEPNSSIKAIELNTYKVEINPNAQQGLSIIGLQKLDFSWHIRGGLRGINLDASLNPIPNTSEADLFAYKLDFETAGYWDGNIGKQTWATQNATTNALETRSYTHNYDASSRLKFSTYTGIGNENFSIINMGYDKNGNITNLQRNGRFGTTGAFGPIDNLSYGYSGNRLNYVVDAIGGDNTVDFVQRGGANYTYWNDGSIKSDANEQIANITYNSFLKQQSEILLTDGRKIKYTYNGAGELINTSYFDASNTIIEKWDFVESTIYKNDVLYQISDDEGRILYANDSYNYEFDYKDHLGNTRTSFQAIGGVLEKTAETAFDPWGVRLNIGLVNAFQNRFEFLNRQKESTFGLNLYRLGARGYNGTTGRFDAVDPVIEGQEQYSTYQYSWNNPVLRSDPNGNCPFCPLLDAVADVGFVIYDIGVLAKEKISTGKTSGENWAALSADAASIAIPMPTGAGLAARAAYKASKNIDKALDAEKIVDKVIDSGKSIEKVSESKKVSTLEKGPYAKESIPATSKDKTFTKTEREQINEIGKKDGCHTCGSKDPKTKSGNFIPDHQPSSALVPDGTPQQLLPHCKNCSAKQGGDVRVEKYRRENNGN